MDQVKKAFAAIKDFWNSLSPARRRLIAILGGGLLAVAVAITIFLNYNSGSYIALYENLDASESSEVYSALLDLGIETRMNAGTVEVKRENAEYARAQLAIQNIPRTTLPYDIFSGSGGLTTTDFEKRQLLVHQLQDRLQDTIKQYEGVENAFVTLSIAQESNRVWEASSARSSGSVSIVLKKGYSLSRDQVSGIKFLVSSSVGNGMEPTDVKVIDAATSLSLKSREDGDLTGTEIGLERLGFEERIEQRLEQKALHSLSLFYDEEDIRATATVVIDYNKMLTESKQYQPSESGGNTGVLEYSEDAYVSDGQSIAGGTVGEENNTDTPVYVDDDGDGQIDYINNARTREYAVSYIIQQIEKDEAQLTSATIAITIKGELDELSRNSIIDTVSKATNIGESRISVQNFVIDEPQPDVLPAVSDEGSDPIILIIAIAAALLVLIIIIIIVILINRKKKKKKAAEAAAAAAAAAAAESEHYDADAHRRAIIESAERSKQENVIANEIREFAHENPEITANILRGWLREDEE